MRIISAYANEASEAAGILPKAILPVAFLALCLAYSTTGLAKDLKDFYGDIVTVAGWCPELEPVKDLLLLEVYEGYPAAVFYTEYLYDTETCFPGKKTGELKQCETTYKVDNNTVSCVGIFVDKDTKVFYAPVWFNKLKGNEI